MKQLSIGQLSKDTQVKIETIRYYERLGLMRNPARKPSSNYRQYSHNDLNRLQFIKNAKELGFSLREISEFLSLRVNHKTTCAEVKEYVVIKVDDVNQKIKYLQAIKKALIKLSTQCSGQGPISDCPILEALNSHRQKPRNKK